MVRIVFLLFSIFLPTVSTPAPAPPVTPAPSPTPSVIVTPPPNPEMVLYASNVTAVWENYRLAAQALAGVAATVAQNPHYIRTQQFTDDIRAVTTGLRIIRVQLDKTRSPTPVEDIHRSLERAADLFTRASLDLDEFAESHDLDDLVDALDRIAAGTALWRATIEELSELLGAPIDLGPDDLSMATLELSGLSLREE